MLKTGDILISEPYLGDQNFERSVILLGSHNEEGSLGFVLNHKSNLLLSDVVNDALTDVEIPLYIGGPVEQDTLHFIYRNELSLKGTIPVIENLFWGGNFDEMKSMLQNKQVKPEDIRFFLGYSGWSKGQLEGEMTQKAWIAHALTTEAIFALDTENMWRSILKNMGGEYKALSNYPIDPRLN
jgi:putative transcriptional regulator